MAPWNGPNKSSADGHMPLLPSHAVYLVHAELEITEDGGPISCSMLPLCEDLEYTQLKMHAIFIV